MATFNSDHKSPEKGVALIEEFHCTSICYNSFLHRKTTNGNFVFSSTYLILLDLQSVNPPLTLNFQSSTVSPGLSGSMNGIQVYSSAWKIKINWTSRLSQHSTKPVIWHRNVVLPVAPWAAWGLTCCGGCQWGLARTWAIWAGEKNFCWTCALGIVGTQPAWHKHS